MISFTSTEERQMMQHYFAYKNNALGAAFAVLKEADGRIAGIYDMLEGVPIDEKVNAFNDLLFQVLYQLYIEGYEFAITQVKKDQNSLMRFLKSRWIILGSSDTYEKRVY
eukprot:Protomagalhaensia_sp_Gyna_25__2685@NODE_2536_length_1028_cov_69_842265_g2104_i0_p1_GENE_NODE_2536_length_1028_cov_69_842265_g2104_i0NODE_2536_length_1028_cov_69_842265_g2104_i0_p1_ORF_typecomplete_len110_score20_06_NODE_2536_length_1028_cov_69_842265_g2104_i0157486